MMPLKLIERVLPWLVGSVKEDEARDILKNIQLAGRCNQFVRSFQDPFYCKCLLYTFCY